MEETKGQKVARIFEYWKQVTKHPRSRLDGKREHLIGARVSDGYSVRDLCRAAFGCANSKWHQGENDRHTIYDSVELIYKNADQVDKFIRLAEEEINRRKHQKQLEEELAQSRLEQSIPGDGYNKARGALLSIVKKREAA
jgi:hypothetical protein